MSPPFLLKLSLGTSTLILDHSGGAIVIGGPALTYYVTPTEEELFKKYNPDLQKKSLANREQKQKDFDDFVCKLKEYSKSDKSSTYHRVAEILVKPRGTPLLTSA